MSISTRFQVPGGGSLWVSAQHRTFFRFPFWGPGCSGLSPFSQDLPLLGYLGILSMVEEGHSKPSSVSPSPGKGRPFLAFPNSLQAPGSAEARFLWASLLVFEASQASGIEPLLTGRRCPGNPCLRGHRDSFPPLPGEGPQAPPILSGVPVATVPAGVFEEKVESTLRGTSRWGVQSFWGGHRLPLCAQ